MAAQPSLRDLTDSAIIHLQNGKRAEAFELACMASAREQAGHKQNLLFAQAAAGLKMTGYNPTVKKAMLAFLRSEKVDYRDALVLWVTMLDFDPAIMPVKSVAAEKEFGAAQWARLEEALNDEIIIEGLRKLIIPDIALERLFQTIRRYLLLELWPQGTLKTKNLTFICALAEQCFLNEYIYMAGEDEMAALSALPLDNPVAAAIAGCYAPLYTLGVSAKLSGMTAWRQLAKLQILQPKREQEILQELESFSDIDNAVSRNVRAMYEENPYPRWRSASLPLEPWDKAVGTMLVAGCGTGRSVLQTGAMYPNVDITAIDITKRSLSYAKRQCEERGVDNITFLHGDILELGRLEKTFDFIECSGVLHHMADPVEGWRRLIEKLNPGGRMLICLYSTKARRAQKAIRERIAAKGYASDAESIRKLRAEAVKDESLQSIQRSLDFYTLSEARDLVFHIQETTYTLAELKEIMDGLGVEFLRFRFPNPKGYEAYRARFPDEPTMASFENWDRLEDENEHLFSNMYQFICKKKGDEVHNFNALAITELAYKS